MDPREGKNRMHGNYPVTLAGSGMALGLTGAVVTGEGAARAQGGARYSLAMASAASIILLAAACAVAGEAGTLAGRLDGSRDVYLSLGDATRSTAGCLPGQPVGFVDYRSGVFYGAWADRSRQQHDRKDIT
jgi:hypothetical protein